jgi:cyclic pyranopterin phosphate synthase
MPDDRYTWIARDEILRFEEITRLARAFVTLGVDKIRLTGGEPLLRRDLPELVRQLCGLEGLRQITLTTNGALLAEQAAHLAAAGLTRINVSIDSLDPEKFRRITRRNDLKRVLDGVFAAREHGLSQVKINAVNERGVNDDEIVTLVDFARTHGFPLRFIEFMDVGNANHWRSERMVPKDEILAIIRTRYELVEIGRDSGSAPSFDFRFADGVGEVGVIASVTEPFCGSCTRVRLTADGHLVTCLFSEQGHDVKAMLRRGADDETIVAFVREVWSGRSDRYSEERWSALNSVDGYAASDKRKIEMIRLGG